MKSLADFLKTTAMGGFLVLLPVVLLYLVLSETLELVVALATPIADLFPKGTFDDAKLPAVVAIVLILGASFLIGLIMRSKAGRQVGNWVEGVVLGKMPVYNALKSITSGFAEAKKGNAFLPAVLASSPGQREIVYVIEDHNDGQMTILVPWAPASFAGSVKVVDKKNIEMLDSNLGDVSRTLSHWGVGVKELLGKADKK